MNIDNTTIIICCAGMGTRLGIGTTKALVNVCDKPIIIRQLELLKNYKDIRIVVGFQAEKVIEIVRKYRNDIMFVFNYDYETTGTAASASKALLGAKEYSIIMDGDLLVNEEDFNKFLTYDNECIAISNITSDEPVLVNVANNKVVSFVKNGEYEWPGLVKIKTNRLIKNNNHVYEMFLPLLPLESINVRTREIDTPDDYERAELWMQNGCND